MTTLSGLLNTIRENYAEQHDDDPVALKQFIQAISFDTLCNQFDALCFPYTMTDSHDNI